MNTEKELTTAEIYAKYVSSCVGITVDIVSTNIFGQTVTGAAAGSGFVITEAATSSPTTTSLTGPTPSR